MIPALMYNRRRVKEQREQAAKSGASDHEHERIGKVRRKRSKRDCKHDPYAQEIAQMITGAWLWLFKPAEIKSALGNGLESTSWSQVCSREKTIFAAMVVFRLMNCAIVQTYFVPDEYWQCIEVAHHQVFGHGYITWEWREGLRSYLYPSIFAILYKVLFMLGMDNRETLVRLPRLLQSIFAAVGDLYLYKLSSKLANPLVAQWALLCQCLSWFTFYCATRTLSNSAESVLITIALYYYPWTDRIDRQKETWKFLWIAAVSVMVRPTAALIWLPLCCSQIYTSRRRLWSTAVVYLVTAIAFLVVSVRLDKSFYAEWVLVPWNFFNFNISKKISEFYGTHSWHWYFTHCLPFVLSTHMIPLALSWRSCKNRSLQVLFLYTLVVYSFLPHKEMRFILPIMPLAMHFCGYYITTVHQAIVKSNEKRQRSSDFEAEVSRTVAAVKEGLKEADSGLVTDSQTQSESLSDSEIIKIVRTNLESSYSRPRLTPRFLLTLIALGNIPMMLYFSTIHQRGPLDVTKFLHSESLVHRNMSVLFLMPCHSTPYYSHIHSNITMRFLTCEPNLTNQTGYVDEADRFYREPIKWLKTEIVKTVKPQVYSHVVMFDSLESKVLRFIRKGKYKLCSKVFHAYYPNDERQGTNILTFCR